MTSSLARILFGKAIDLGGISVMCEMNKPLSQNEFQTNTVKNVTSQQAGNDLISRITVTSICNRMHTSQWVVKSLRAQDYVMWVPCKVTVISHLLAKSCEVSVIYVWCNVTSSLADILTGYSQTKKCTTFMLLCIFFKWLCQMLFGQYRVKFFPNIFS